VAAPEEALEDAVCRRVDGELSGLDTDRVAAVGAGDVDAQPGADVVRGGVVLQGGGAGDLGEDLPASLVVHAEPLDGRSAHKLARRGEHHPEDAAHDLQVGHILDALVLLPLLPLGGWRLRRRSEGPQLARDGR
jgi:hypothetical protein